MKKKSPKKKMVKVAKGKKISRAQEKKLEKKPGNSNVGKYKNVSPKDFVGAAGGSSKYAYPVPDLKHARSALKLAHNSPNPEGIKRAVYKKYPQLNPANKKKKSKK
jgi:hypothetical protein